MDVGAWLRDLGLGQYESLFHQNDIDPEVLRELTDGDLEKLGLSLGHRKRLLKAIANLGSTETVAKPTSPAPIQSSTDAAERRQLTVMFCDLVGSTAMSTRFDPEDFGDLIRAFQGAVTKTAARFEGHVAKFMGDGALIYFGYPKAHEDDGERAARAGLALVDAVGALCDERGVALEVRAGIATGLVVVGELMGEGEARERGVVGETPNLAARLQALAEPGSVVIAEATRKLLGGAFELKPLGPQELKGFDAPVAVWAVVRETEHISRFEASRSEGLTPFVGREHEVALLLERWRDAAAGEGQVVLISGEAGIGKSRILAALRERIGEERHVALRYQCSPHHVNDAFYPIVGQIWRAGSLASGEPAAARLDKLEAMIARSRLDSQEIAPLLASLLSVPTEGRYPTLEMAPSEQKERTIAALIDVFIGLTKDAPALALLEDAHWIDPTSFDLFGRLIESLQGLRALLVVTHRPEFATPWASHAHVTSLSLNRFGRRHSLALIDRVTGGKSLPSEVLEQIVAKTDGVPLFVEELTKTVLESGLLREESGSYVLAAALTPLAIPSTLQGSLMARLDRLAPVKEIAQIGAAIGREFSYRLLEAVAPIKGAALRDALAQLMAAELIYGRGAPPEATYVFKHALVQDTAYASLLRRRRQRIHADIARALSDRFANRADATIAFIAHHYTQAEMTEPAARSWLAAAASAQSHSASVEAERYVDAGMALLPRLTDGFARKSLELAFLLARIEALMSLKGHNAPEIVAALTTAKQLIDDGHGSNLQAFSVLNGFCMSRYIAAQWDDALALALEMVEVAERQDEDVYKIVGYRTLADVKYYMGRVREALEIYKQAECDYTFETNIGFSFGRDHKMAILCYKILSLMYMGQYDQAARVRAEVQLKLKSHVRAQAIASCVFLSEVVPDFILRNFEESERHMADLITYCSENKVENVRRRVAIHQACSRATREPSGENLAALRAQIDAHHRSGERATDFVFMSHLAEALLASGDALSADAVLQETFGFVEQSGERFWLAELYRICGEIARHPSRQDFARAETSFLQAIETARSQEARLFELRAATDLAQLWRDTGSLNDAHALLEPILVAIKGGEATQDVRNARALLAAIA